MDYKIEKPIRLNGSGPHGGLYQWFIEEMDPATKQLGPNYVPWSWALYFEARELTVVRALEFKDEKPPTLKQHIKGQLFPETKDRRAAARYSFFGTDRTIESITLNIVRSVDGKEGILTSGSLGYDYDWDFEDRTQSDWVEIEIALSAEKFDALADVIADGCSTGIVRIGVVEGFYSEWSPSIRTKEIKILSSLHDQKVKLDAEGVVPLVLGKVGEFSLRLATQAVDAKPLDGGTRNPCQQR